MIRRFLIHLLGIQSAVAGIVVNGDKILLTRRSSLLAEGGKWCLPGGGMKKWENAEKAMRRELKEETGLGANKIKLLFVQEEIVKRLNLHANVFVFEIKSSTKIKTNWEVTEHGWFSFMDISKLDLAFSHRDILNKYYMGKK